MQTYSRLLRIRQNHQRKGQCRHRSAFPLCLLFQPLFRLHLIRFGLPKIKTTKWWFLFLCLSPRFELPSSTAPLVKTSNAMFEPYKRKGARRIPCGGNYNLVGRCQKSKPPFGGFYFVGADLIVFHLNHYILAIFGKPTDEIIHLGC